MSTPTLRVLHFGDVHVQESALAVPIAELAGKRVLAFANLWFKRGRLFRESLPKLEALTRFAQRERIDFALCTGDYTAVGSEAEYCRARAAIDGLTRAALGFCTVPGNHDLYLDDTLRSARFERHFGEFTRSDWPEFACEGGFPFLRLVSDALAVIGVNSARPNPNPFLSSGCVSPQQLAALARLLEDPRLAGRRVIVMTHYGIVRADGDPDSIHHGLENASELARTCARPGVLLVHGHIHNRYFLRPAPERPWLFCSGSATQRGREGLWLYELEHERLFAIPGSFASGEYVLAREQAVEVTR